MSVAIQLVFLPNEGEAEGVLLPRLVFDLDGFGHELNTGARQNAAAHVG